MSSLLKQRISSPLEAGPSILDSQSLPPHLTQALEYASKRLTRKALHITLVVVRKDYELPSSTLPCATPTSSASGPASPEFSWSSGPLSPSRFTSPVAGLRQLVRRGTGSSIASASTVSTTSEASSRSAAASPTFAPHATEAPSHTLLAGPRKWPSTPATPCTPATPYSAVTSTSTSSASSTSSTASAGGPNPFGIRLLHTTPLSPKEEYTLRRTISKAERKFQTGTGFLPSPSSASSCGLNTDLIRRCIRQNEVIFSSEGLTLLGLDRLYTFKSALAAYARTTLRGYESVKEREARIEDAVDELRRLVLSRGGRRLERRELYGCYAWIGVSAGALGDVERMYRRAYGGMMNTGAFEEAVRTTAATATTTTTTKLDEVKTKEKEQEEQTEWPLKMSVARTPSTPAGVVKIGKPPTPKASPKAHTPVLKLQTTFEKPVAIQKPSVIRPTAVKPSSAPAAKDANQNEVLELEIKIDAFSDNEDEEEDGDLTARPTASASSGAAGHGMSFWSGIDEMLARRDQPEAVAVAVSPVIQRLRASQQRLGPVTPNGYDDISPVTRGEWGFLFKGDGWNGGRTAAVETC